PPYLLPFLGTAKVLGAIAILSPGFRLLKEWAYAGLAFDLIGAVYSHISVGDPITIWGVAAVGLLLLTASYLSLQKLSAEPIGKAPELGETSMGRFADPI